MSGKYINTSDNYGPHLDEILILEEWNIERDHRNLVDKSLDIESCARDSLLECIPQDEFLASELSSLLREIWFNEQEFPINKLISDIKYNYLGFQNNNPFYPFNDQRDYILINYFAMSKTIKGNVNRFLSDPLMVSIIKKLFYQNIDK